MRKLISALLALTMMVSASPAFAEETSDDAVQPQGEQVEQVEQIEQPEPKIVEKPAESPVESGTSGEKSARSSVVITVYDEVGVPVFEKEEMELKADMTLQDIAEKLSEERKTDIVWDRCAYFINEEEIRDIDIETFRPDDGDNIVVRAADHYADEDVTCDATIGAEADILEVPQEMLDKTFEKTAEIISTGAAKDKWAFGNEWSVISLTRSGLMDEKNAKKYCVRIASYLAGKKTAKLDSNTSSFNSRLAIALTSLGYDATDVNGMNLLEPLADMEYVTRQGINGPVFALIAFDSHDYDIPKAKNGEKQTTREGLVEILVKKQIGETGWAYGGSLADVDMTAMVIQALTPYRSMPEVKSAIGNALNWLSGIQNDDGSFATGDKASSESQSQVLVALAGLGINPETNESFISKKGKGVVDALMSFALSSGGFKHVSSGKMDDLATQQGYYALVALYRFRDGLTSLYDMSDIEQLNKFTAKAEKGDKGTNTSEERTAGKPMGCTRSLGFLSLGVAAKDRSNLITETDETVTKGDTLSDGMEYNALQEKKKLQKTLPWIYMAIGSLAALALVVLLRERGKSEE